MKSTGIYRAISASVLLHALIFTAGFLILRYTAMNRNVMPYMVSLVTESTARSGPDVSNVNRQEPAKMREPQKKAVEKEAATPPKTTVQPRQERSKKEDDTRVKESIEALKTKKNLERMVALRKMIDVDATRNPVAPSQRATEGVSRTGAGGSTSGGGDYYSLVVNRIRQHWIFPESIDRDLEAVVSIRIARDGRVNVERLEKGSGNALFDRSVLRAISLASPLPVPPQEMQIGVRFRP